MDSVTLNASSSNSQEERQEITTLHSDHIYQIVCEFVDHDLLGLLLSTTHLQSYCAFRVTTCEPEHLLVIQKLATDFKFARDFQQRALADFSCLHIDACCFKNESELAEHLQQKMKNAFHLDLTSWPGVNNPLEIQNAWKYRRCCQGIHL